MDCYTQKLFIWYHYPFVYEALYFLISANKTNKMTHHIDLIYAPPTQLNVGYTISKYLHGYKDYLENTSSLKNDYETLDDPYVLDKFMLVANHCFEFRIWSPEERHSKDSKNTPNDRYRPLLTPSKMKF